MPAPSSCEPWKEIYVQDEARWQTFEEAERIGHHIKNVYRSSGYEIIELPECTVEQRVDLILKRIQTMIHKIAHFRLVVAALIGLFLYTSCKQPVSKEGVAAGGASKDPLSAKTTLKYAHGFSIDYYDHFSW